MDERKEVPERRDLGLPTPLKGGHPRRGQANIDKARPRRGASVQFNLSVIHEPRPQCKLGTQAPQCNSPQCFPEGSSHKLVKLLD